MMYVLFVIFTMCVLTYIYLTWCVGDNLNIHHARNHMKNNMNYTNCARDIYGKTIVKANSFIYLGYPFIDTDTED